METVFKFGDNVDTDVIVPARYMNDFSLENLALHCMAGLRPGFSSQVSHGDIIVAGTNFGCGSSQVHAPIAIREVGISVVIAHSFARIFYRNAFNMGLPILESPEAVSALHEGKEVDIDLELGLIVRRTDGRTSGSQPIPPFMRELIEPGGLIAYAKKRHGFAVSRLEE